jgi:hypothetical protein
MLSENLEVYLLTIYDKSEFDNIEDASLKMIIASIDSKKQFQKVTKEQERGCNQCLPAQHSHLPAEVGPL